MMTEQNSVVSLKAAVTIFHTITLLARGSSSARDIIALWPVVEVALRHPPLKNMSTRQASCKSNLDTFVLMQDMVTHADC
jgi:hypothetical protein